jgi:prepilin-type processing-associated H-X9-DG protein
VTLNPDGTLTEPFGGDFASPGDAINAYGANCTQFRFARIANVAFLDGHVENRSPVDLPMPPNTFPQAVWDQAKTRLDLGFLDSANLPYTGQP